MNQKIQWQFNRTICTFTFPRMTRKLMYHFVWMMWILSGVVTQIYSVAILNCTKLHSNGLKFTCILCGWLLFGNVCQKCIVVCYDTKIPNKQILNVRLGLGSCSSKQVLVFDAVHFNCIWFPLLAVFFFIS